jgi:hypothetical protein
MKDVTRFSVCAAAFGSLMTFSAVSLAHVDLSTPNPRAHGETEGNLKSGPCGQTTNGRTANVNVFAPGQTITVTWNEYIDHPAYYRIAFDDDGDDGFLMRTDGQTDPTADDPDTIEAALNMDAQILAIVKEENDTTAGPSTDIRSVDVTLPNVTCENCTLQVIQYMYNNPGQGYFQCADIALRAAEQVGENADAGLGGEGGSASAGEAGAAGAGGAPSSGSAGTSSGGSASTPLPPRGGTGGTGGTGAAAGAGGAPSGAAGSAASTPVASDDDDDDGGCTISTHASDGSSAGLVSLLALGLGLIARRRS